MKPDRMSRISLAGLAEALAADLRRALPGPAAQARFAPELSFGRHFGPVPESARQAAVVALLYPSESEAVSERAPGDSANSLFSGWRLPLIVRPEHLEHHAGQIGLPGGMIELNESPAEAALRELHEELGVPSHEVEILGPLSPLYVYVSDNYVTPYVAIAGRAPTFILNVDEVAEIVALPLDCLFACRIATEIREHRGVRFQAPYLAFGSHHIWGATAMILSELAAVLKRLSGLAVRESDRPSESLRPA
jgi:8-oxo-dGTP pyrophosphatase MutT (NUDIX family)